MKALSVCFAALVLMAVLVSRPAQALLIGDGYEDSIVLRFNTLEVWTELNRYSGFPYSPIAGNIYYDIIVPNPDGFIKLEVFDEPHIANLDPIGVHQTPLNLGIGIGRANNDETLVRDGDGALRVSVEGGVIDLTMAFYVENSGDQHFIGSWFAGEIPPVPHPVPSPPVPEPSTLLTVISGLAMWGGLAWRRHRK